jgi:hypothetical protein
MHLGDSHGGREMLVGKDSRVLGIAQQPISSRCLGTQIISTVDRAFVFGSSEGGMFGGKID